MTKTEVRDRITDIKFELISLMSNKELSVAEIKYIEEAYSLLHVVTASLYDRIKEGEKHDS